jgi:hypothetical protein
VKKEPMTATQLLTTNWIKMLRGFLCLFRRETMCKWLQKKQATQSVIAKFASAHFQLKSEQAN